VELALRLRYGRGRLRPECRGEGNVVGGFHRKARRMVSLGGTMGFFVSDRGPVGQAGDQVLGPAFGESGSLKDCGPIRA